MEAIRSFTGSFSAPAAPAQGAPPAQAQTGEQFTPTPPADPHLSAADQLRRLASGGLSALRNLVPHVDVQPHEREAIQRMIDLMPQLEGQDGLFNQGSRDAITNSVLRDPALHQRIAGEIENRRQEWVNGRDIRVLPGLRYGMRDRLSERNVNRNYGQYFNQGMGQARDTINGQLNQGFVHMGVTEPANRDDRPRQVTMGQLEQYGRDAQVLDAISQRAQAQGLPRFTFPRGIGAADLRAIMNGTLPPNGRMAPR